MAARGARAAAGGEAAAHRHPYEPDRGRSGRTDPHRGVRTRPAGIGLDCRWQPAAEHPLGRGRSRPLSQIRGGIGRTLARRHRRHRRLDRGDVAAGEPHRADRVRDDDRPGGFVASLARPGGNATGFTTSEFSMFGKRLELLKEIAPGVTRVAVIRDPSVPAGSGGFAAIQTVAPSLRVELTPIGVRDGDEIDHAIAAFARSSNGGLIVVGPTSSVASHLDLIITLAARHRLPAVYSNRTWSTAGGLISYGADP